jgi:diketogulonate reductase-like aldo/keto reductase
VAAVATEVARSPAQVLLRWGVQHGFVVLPKSTRAARIAENADLFGFELSSAQMALLDGLEEGLVTGWDPAKQD